ncbi:MAG: hypothetical protein AMXMBFR4_15200 [Candidatus Hydrogenedentota bacterium]
MKTAGAKTSASFPSGGERAFEEVDDFSNHDGVFSRKDPDAHCIPGTVRLRNLLERRLGFVAARGKRFVVNCGLCEFVGAHIASRAAGWYISYAP